MRNKRKATSSRLPFDPDPNEEPHSQVSVSELADVLRDLGGFLGTSTLGNPTIGAAINRLSRILRKYADRELQDVLNGLTIPSGRPIPRKNPQVGALADVEVPSLELIRVRALLQDENLTKGDLIQLGSKRFGIPESTLMRQNKSQIRSSVEAALRNSEALDILAEEASREGSRRRLL